MRICDWSSDVCSSDLWTGDTTHDDASLQREVRNAVYTGVYQPFAYTSTDLGGHMGTPTTEQYCRWLPFGAMSPIFRLHCTAGITRDRSDERRGGTESVSTGRTRWSRVHKKKKK